MIQVEIVPLEIALPIEDVRLVALQPYVQLVNEEPFQWDATAKASQFDSIRKTLNLSGEDSGGGPAHFTVFPEYSIPGIDGARIIEERVSSDVWHNESVVIAGIDGLSKTEYQVLCEELDVTVAQGNEHTAVGNHQWVNCCIIWVKNQDGQVDRWLQPKIRPAWAERDLNYLDMFQGSTVFTFQCRFANGSPCRFATLICYDWVGKVDGNTVVDEVLADLNVKADGNLTALNWMFVIQHNNAPNHYTFLNSTLDFLNDRVTHPLVDTRDTVVMHANTAATETPSASIDGIGAFTACVFSPTASLTDTGSLPTFCMRPMKIRKSDILKQCKDVVFREMGECIHMFQVRVPRFAGTDATDRAHPLRDAHVYPTRPNDDPRTSGEPIPAAVKWVNDVLDSIECLSTRTLMACSLQAEAESTGVIVISGLRPKALTGREIVSKIDWAAATRLDDGKERGKEREQNADLWSAHEVNALSHIVYAATSLGLAYNFDTKDTAAHCSLMLDSGFVDVVAVRASSHENCRKHFDQKKSSMRLGDVLVVARDRDNNKATPEEYRTIYEAADDDGPAFIDYQTLSDYCRSADDSETLRTTLDGYLPKPQRIL